MRWKSAENTQSLHSMQALYIKNEHSRHCQQQSLRLHWKGGGAGMRYMATGTGTIHWPWDVFQDHKTQGACAHGLSQGLENIITDGIHGTDALNGDIFGGIRAAGLRPLRVKTQQRLGLAMVNLQTATHGSLVIIIAMN